VQLPLSLDLIYLSCNERRVFTFFPITNFYGRFLELDFVKACPFYMVVEMATIETARQTYF